MKKCLFALIAAAACLVGFAGTASAQYGTFVRPASHSTVVVRPVVVRVARPRPVFVGSHCGVAAPSCVRVFVGRDCHGRPVFRTRCR